MRLFRTRASDPVVADRKGSWDSDVTSTYSGNSNGEETKQRRKSSLGKLLSKPKKSHSLDLPRSPFVTLPTHSKPQTRLRNQSLQGDFPVIDISQAYERDKQTGERVIDHTDLLHSLVHQESSENVPRLSRFKGANGNNVSSNGPTQTGDEFFAHLPFKLWRLIFDELSVADRVGLSLASKVFRQHLISSEAELELPENTHDRTEFLLRLDPELPSHLFCFACHKYHVRLNPRKESLKPSNVANPLFNCPHAQNLDKRVTRIRVTSGRTLPFTFVQLAIRAHHFSPLHGITLDSLSRRWRDKPTNSSSFADWSHQTRYAIVDDRLLIRVISTSFAAPNLPPAGLRNLLYNPSEEFHPYFSTCPHWRDGDLMPTVKCALSHIPKSSIEGGGIDRVTKEVKARVTSASSKFVIVTLCNNCRPIRRCPSCPTEYLIEIKTAEDRNEPDPSKSFKQALVVTRWSDLGDGSSPVKSREWMACAGVDGSGGEAGSGAGAAAAVAAAVGEIQTSRTNGKGVEEEEATTVQRERYDSFKELGKRAINGIFESQFNVDFIPGQRMLNMNPNDERRGESGHNWY